MGCMFSSLAAKFAFFPPSPPTYQINKGDNGKLTVVSSPSSSSSTSMPLPLADDASLDVLLIDTKKGNKIVAFYLKNPCARLTLLYSHGNAADLGQLYDLFVQLKINLRVNIMGYDYSGYGASSGKINATTRVASRALFEMLTTSELGFGYGGGCDVQPSESNTYADIEAVYQCLQTEYGVSQEDIILYGQSVGSGPTLHLAAKLPRLRGVVLHSAILSGLRVLCHVKFTCCFDIYKNMNKIRKVKCPVLVIHGTEDDVVNWLHGNGLWKLAREPYEPLWIKGGGHCNLELYPDYIRHLCKFIQEMENINTQIQLRKIRQNLKLKPKSKAAKCCRVKLWRPKCPQCFRPRCIKCSCQLPRCGLCCCQPRCPTFGMPSCLSCLKCCCQPRCPTFGMPSCSSCLKCWMPSCSGCLNCQIPCCCCGSNKCLDWQCCGGTHSKQDG